MFRLAWRQKGYGNGRSIHQWTRGVSRYSCLLKAASQCLRFQDLFPQNQYIIERC